MKKQKHSQIEALINERQISNQTELLRALLEKGVSTTQASISRDLKKLGVVKRDGYYQLQPQSNQLGSRSSGNKYEITPAGDNLIVLRTSAGNASPIALAIDEASIAGMLGCIAGDDTIFVAVANKRLQTSVMEAIIETLKN